jgi:hypothetical protein
LQQLSYDAAEGLVRKKGEQVNKLLDIVVNVKYIVSNINLALFEIGGRRLSERCATRLQHRRVDYEYE